MHQLVTIASYSNPIEANLHKAKLESHDIACFLMDENMVSIVPFYSLAIGNIKLKVPASESDRAIKILSDKSDITLTDNFKLNKENETSPENKCPCCLSTNIYQNKYSRKSLLSFLLIGFPVPIRKKGFRCFDCGFEWKNADKS